MIQKTINREVGLQSKGVHLQKLRAIKLLLQKMQDPKISVYVAIEFQDDVYLRSVNGSKTEEYTESDKNHESKNAFSFMSEEVKNSLVSFIDCWIRNKMNENLRFGFYTNINYGKENQTEYINSLGIKLPSRPLLSYLIEGSFDQPEVLSIIKTVIIDEYKKQYEKHDIEGYYQTVKEMPDDIWVQFLSSIDWQFGQENEEELEKRLIDLVSKSTIYDSVKISGKEKYIISALEVLIEKKQTETDLLAKCISHSDVKIIFLEIANDIYKRQDPIYELWEAMIPPSDKRNIKEKILDVCDSFDSAQLNRMARKIAGIKIELNKVDSRGKSSYQYRIFEACEQEMSTILLCDGDIKPEHIYQWIDILHDKATKHLDDKSQDYSYPLKNKEAIKDTILELFDSCYLSFNNTKEA